MKHKCGIYVIYNKITDKYYVGRTSNFRKRFMLHCRQLHNGKHRNLHLQHSYNKYGDEAFMFRIVDYIPKECYNEFMKLRELYFMNYYDSIENGYNIATSSEGGDTYTNNPRKSAIIEKRKKYAKEHKDEYSKRNSGENNPMYGKHHKESSKLIMKEKASNGSRAGENNPMYGKPCSETRKMNIKRGQERGRIHRKFPDMPMKEIMKLVNAKYPI